MKAPFDDETKAEFEVGNGSLSFTLNKQPYIMPPQIYYNYIAVPIVSEQCDKIFIDFYFFGGKFVSRYHLPVFDERVDVVPRIIIYKDFIYCLLSRDFSYWWIEKYKINMQ